ncbi:uncharacterized protein OCT59_005065 [Rhizophagus irregularis]|uniref:F-box domain-containing protein n=2 Tax=Rhizophagus irregularis TaxID=588596 RepID=A0A2I1G0R7_9GLOM|nr:hypothetical protein RhiirA4_453551 [Rhizophagus irregularis]UZO13568.1 hypothetical protein OCT59_005065 [Rhizophagus irregularis]
MPRQLPADCLNEIFEHLEKDKATLHSCLLVNRLWCEVTVRILWRNIWIINPVDYVDYSRRLKVGTSILNTLIACLPNKSKTHLLEKGILNSTHISKTPLFNYASFCKVLSIHMIGQMIIDVFKNQKYLAKEIMKMFMETVSLKKLSYYTSSKTINLSFLRYPGAKGCLTNLSKLSCNSNVKSAFFYKLSQICCNIQSLTIEFNGTISSDLKNLISSQNNLKHLSLSRTRTHSTADWADIIPSLAKHSNSLIRLKVHWRKYNYWNKTEQLSFITTFTNLQELILSFHHKDCFAGLNSKLLDITFPQLQILKFLYEYPEDYVLSKFLENNGKNLKEFYINCSNTISAIAEFCPNLKFLSTLFRFDKIESLKTVLNNCQQLESIDTQYYYGLLSEKELLGTLAKYSPKNFHKLKVRYYSYSQLVPEDLEEFFINWENRVSQRSISLVFRGCMNSFGAKEENMGIIKKYRELGIIKKFELK